MIRFHFLDATISSGTTIRRAQSILRSLFPEKAFSDNSSVKVSLFDTVTLLINRCSSNTMEDFVRRGNFHRFIDVKISSMRSHHDNACILCNQKLNYELIMSCCSTNEMYEWWRKKWKKISPITYEQILLSENKGIEKPERDFLRLQSSHVFSDRLAKYSQDSINKTNTIRAIIIELFNETIANTTLSASERLENLISYVKVISRPFLAYRKSTLEAIFCLLIEMMEMITSMVLSPGTQQKSPSEKSLPHDLNKLNEFLFDIYSSQIGTTQIRSDKNHTDELKGQIKMAFDSEKVFADLFVVLTVQLSNLGAKYLMRKDNMSKIIKTAKSLHKINLLDNISWFEELYRASIKRIIVLNKDESIGLWFEWLLCVGKECGNILDGGENLTEIKPLINNVANESPDSLGFYELLFLENTHVLYDAMEEFDRKVNQVIDEEKMFEECEEHTVKKHINEYYFENYRKFMLFDYYFEYWLESNNPPPVSILKNNEVPANDDIINETVQLLKFYRKLKTNNNRAVASYYRDLCHLIKDVTKTENVSIWGWGWSKEPYKIASTNGTTWENCANCLTEIEETKTTTVINDGIVIMFKNTYSKNGYEQTTNKIYIIIEDGNKNKSWTTKRLLMVRKVLAFRSDFVKQINKDFINDAFEYTSILDRSLEPKVGSHSEDSVRRKVCKLIKRKINEIQIKDNNIGMDKSDDELQQLLLLAQLAADSLISQLYILSLKNEAIERAENLMQGGQAIEDNNIKAPDEVSDDTLVFDKNLICFFENISSKREDDGLNQRTYLKLIVENEEPILFENTFPQGKEHYAFLILFALFQNAVKYGHVIKRTTETEKSYVEVNVSLDTNYLTISNLTSIYAHSSPGDEKSITLKAIQYFYETFNHQIHGGHPPKKDKEEIQRFTIKLPITNKKGGGVKNG